jgi:sugar phosphate permease
LIIGFISDYLKPLKACIIMMLVNVFSLILFIKGGQTSNVNMLLIASFLFGSVYSVGAVGIPLLTKYFFGVDNFAAVYSKIGFLTSVGSSLSLTIIGYIYDFTGGYLMAFVGVIIFHIINLCLLFIINKHRVVSNT